MRTFAMAVVAAITPAVLAGPFDAAELAHQDEGSALTAAQSVARTPVVSNAEFVSAFDEVDPFGAHAARIHHTAPLRRAGRSLNRVPYRPLRPVFDGLDGAGLMTTSGVGGLDFAPTPGSVALVSLGGLGLVSRRSPVA